MVLQEVEALQDLSSWLRNRGFSEVEISGQVEALGVHPADDSQANSQLLGGSDGAHEGEGLVPACDVLGGCLPTSTVPDFILPFLSEAALQEILVLPL